MSRLATAFRANWRLAVPASLFALLVLMAAFGPFFTKDPNATSLRSMLQPVGSAEHILGTDSIGRDLLARGLDGARISLTVGLVASAAGLVFGGGIGMISGYLGGRFDAAVMRLMDILLAFPSLILALSIASALGAGLRSAIIAAAVFVVPTYARLARAASMSIREHDFVTAARFMGVGRVAILWRHVLPNVLLPLAAYGMLAMGLAMIVEAALSFLGLGVRAPQSTWGVMIAEGRPFMARSPAVVLVPGAFLFIAVFLINLIGDELRRRSDVRVSVV